MIKGLLLDLDGTVYKGAAEVPGAAAFINGLEARGVRHLFVTNRANRTPYEISAHLQEYGIVCTEEHVLTTARATALYLKSGSVYYIGEEGLRIELEHQGLTITDRNPDYVVVSFDRGFTYQKLKTACRLIENGARFIATNPDKALKTENGMSPGTGAIVAAVAAGCGVEPLVIGKPHRRIFDLATEQLGLHRDEVAAIGDNIETDIAAGAHAGIRTALLLTGVTSRDDLAASSVEPTWVAETYDELTNLLFP
jgi:4-nitrophenyl phosphatase